MTHLRPGSRKLWHRALALLQELAGVDEGTAHDALERAYGNVAEALAVLRVPGANVATPRGPRSRTEV
jgi:N-acetylmuramic acid 6-phosphate (MurNAc-6-P) etherase